MKRFLLPKRAMAGLAVAAAALAWLTLPMTPRTTAVPGEDVALKPDPNPDEVRDPAELASTLLQPSGPSVSSPAGRSLRQRLARRATPSHADSSGRDPFVYGITPESTLAQPGDSAAMPQLVVQGISVGHGKALAVVNRTILGVGDRLGNWQVVRIVPEAVSLEGPAGHLTLRLPRGSDPGEPKTHASPSFAAETDFDVARSASRSSKAPSHP